MFAALLFAKSAFEAGHGSVSLAIGLGISLLCAYVAVTVAALTVRDFRYQRAAKTAGLTRFDLRRAPFLECLPHVIQSGKDVSLTESFEGKLGGTPVYIFDYSFGTAWFSKKRTVAVLGRPANCALPANLALRLAEQCDADLALHPNWFIVHRRRRTTPAELRGWLTTVSSVLNLSG